MIELGKYGATAFPLIFAAVVARLMKVIALWRSEKGARLGVRRLYPSLFSMDIALLQY